MASLKKPSAIGKAKRKIADISQDVVGPDASSSALSSVASASGSDSGSELEDSPAREAEAVPVLSHAEKRRQKKRKLNSGDAVPVDVSSESHTKPASASTSSNTKKGKGKKGKKSGEVCEGGDSLPRRQNSVWIGNLAYKTTGVMLKSFFEGLEVTRVHMPLKAPPSGARPKVNSGFAYVDFATPDAKMEAIALSERNLEGRRLLIKDAEDFSGRPAVATNEDGATTGILASKRSALKTSLTKTSQKILAAQKQPPGPTLFFGNLGFETTEDSIRQLLEAHRKKDPVKTPVGDESSDGETEDGEPKVTLKSKGPKKEDQWIRKIRMGTFEDSGKCKGWAFVDFTSTEHATFALINPRNRSLDGRKLTVEYASPDAVRRGGGPRELWINAKTSAEQFQKKGERRSNKNEGKSEKQRGGVEKPVKKGLEKRLKYGPGVEKPPAGKGERQKPGAALALAQRGTAAILPSQGQKTKF